MTLEEEKFVENWQYYHKRGKWIFILAYGTIIGLFVQLVFEIINFLYYQPITLSSFQSYFFSQKFLAGILIYIMTVGIIVGYGIWYINDVHFKKLGKIEED